MRDELTLVHLQFYIAMIRQETERIVHHLPPPIRHDVDMSHRDTEGYFGYFWIEVAKNFGRETYDSYTISQVANLELNCIERVLRRALC